MDPIEALRIRGIGVGKKLVGDAQAGDVRAGKTFSNAQSNSNTGTLPVRSLAAQTVTPTTVTQTMQAGIYDGDITVQGDTNLATNNIVSGKSIFGVAGNVTPKKIATGNFTPGSVPVVQTITGLAFRPQFVWVYTKDTTSGQFYVDTIFLVDNPYRGLLKDGNNINRNVVGLSSYQGIATGGAYIMDLDSANNDILSDGFRVKVNGTTTTHYWVAIG